MSRGGNCIQATRKRKSEEQDDAGTFRFDDLHQDILEKILSRLPVSSFFRLGSVCKRWKSIADSASFRLACSEITFREPWYYMVSCGRDGAVIFDSNEKNWKCLNPPNILRDHPGSVPVASSSGLICFRTESGDFVVLNPVTGSFHEIENPFSENCHKPIHAIVMQSIREKSNTFRLILVYGEIPRLYFKVFHSKMNKWEEEIMLNRMSDSDIASPNYADTVKENEDPIYFLSKSGNVVVTNMLRSPSKQFSSVITSKNSQEMVYFISPSGKIIACNIATKAFDEYPRLLPLCAEYSIDVVECGGELVVVLLSEFFETASLRMWKFVEKGRFWQQTAAMPPWMSHGFYGKKVDINCAGGGEQVFVCLSSGEMCRYVVYDFGRDEWEELPSCCVNGEAMDFMSAFCFEPRIEASVG